ncbi:MAG TPA: hypothetical protein VF628_06735 [Allosphingosinicella sp.]|jgi:hypothetical protein
MLKKVAVACLLVTMSAQPALAAGLDAGDAATGGQNVGAFAGARLRLTLGAAPKASAAVTLAPMQRAWRGDGSIQTRFGEGLALGTAGGEPVALRLAGTRVDRLHLAQNGKVDGTARRHGISTLGYVAIGVGVILVGAFIAYGAIGDAATE